MARNSKNPSKYRRNVFWYFSQLKCIWYFVNYKRFNGTKQLEKLFYSFLAFQLKMNYLRQLHKWLFVIIIYQ